MNDLEIYCGILCCFFIFVVFIFLVFHFLESVLWFRKLLTLVYFLFTYVVLLFLLSLSYINNCFIPIFKNLIFLVIKIVFLIHFELFFIEHEKGISIYSFTCGYQVGAILLPRTFPHLIVSSKITVFKYNDLFRVFSMCCWLTCLSFIILTTIALWWGWECVSISPLTFS